MLPNIKGKLILFFAKNLSSNIIQLFNKYDMKILSENAKW